MKKKAKERNFLKIEIESYRQDIWSDQEHDTHNFSS